MGGRTDRRPRPPIGVCIAGAALVCLGAEAPRAEVADASLEALLHGIYAPRSTARTAATYLGYHSDEPGADYKGRRAAVGGDIARSWSTRLTTSLGVRYEWGRLDTYYDGARVDTKGIAVTPHLIYALGALPVTLHAGLDLAFFDNDASRAGGAVTGDYRSRHYAGSVSVARTRIVPFEIGRALIVNGYAGYWHSFAHTDSYVESDGGLVASTDRQHGAINVGGRLGVEVDHVAETYILSRVDWTTTSRRPATDPIVPDKSNVTVGAGHRRSIGYLGFATVQATTSLMSRHQERWSVIGQAGFRF